MPDGTTHESLGKYIGRTTNNVAEYRALIAGLEKAKELGASVMVPPQDIPKTGRFAVLQDPQVAMFAVFKIADH